MRPSVSETIGIRLPASATTTGLPRGAQTRNSPTSPPLPPIPLPVLSPAGDAAPDLQPVSHPRGSGAGLGRPRRPRRPDGIRLALRESDPLPGLLGESLRREGPLPPEPRRGAGQRAGRAGASGHRPHG